MDVRVFRYLTTTAALFAAAPALAVPTLIDFTDALWSAASGETTYSQTFGSTSVTLNAAEGGTLTFNGHEAPASTSGLDFLSLAGDGIGIGDDEIGYGDRLEVSFSSNVTVLAYYLLDLFPGEGPDSDGESARIFAATVSGSGSLLEMATTASPGGFFARQGISVEGVSALAFSTSDLAPFNDFSLAGLWIDDGSEGVSVPEPGAFGLFGAGLLGFVLLRGRRRSMRV